MPDATAQLPAVPDPLADREADETVRFRAEGGDEWIVATVDDVRTSAEDRYAAVTVIENEYKGDIYDLETHWDERVPGWTSIRVVRRGYDDTKTEFVDEGELDEIETVSVGIDPVRLRPGDTIESAQGVVYRVVVPPVDREYDRKALCYDLYGNANTVTKVDTSDLLPATLERPEGGEPDGR